jgi:hypothetical protein
MVRHLQNISDYRVHFVTEGEAHSNMQGVVERLIEKMSEWFYVNLKFCLNSLISQLGGRGKNLNRIQSSQSHRGTPYILGGFYDLWKLIRTDNYHGGAFCRSLHCDRNRSCQIRRRDGHCVMRRSFRTQVLTSCSVDTNESTDWPSMSSSCCWLILWTSPRFQSWSPFSALNQE